MQAVSSKHDFELAMQQAGMALPVATRRPSRAARNPTVQAPAEAEADTRRRGRADILTAAPTSA